MIDYTKELDKHHDVFEYDCSIVRIDGKTEFSIKYRDKKKCSVMGYTYSVLSLDKMSKYVFKSLKKNSVFIFKYLNKHNFPIKANTYITPKGPRKGLGVCFCGNKKELYQFLNIILNYNQSKFIDWSESLDKYHDVFPYNCKVYFYNNTFQFDLQYKKELGGGSSTGIELQKLKKFVINQFNTNNEYTDIQLVNYKSLFQYFEDNQIKFKDFYLDLKNDKKGIYDFLNLFLNYKKDVPIKTIKDLYEQN